MKKTLLLCFIHGFKGGDSTFGSFPEYLKVIVNNALPNIYVHALVYPKYETRGDLEECVKEFKEWLLENVIDLEVKNESDSPTVNPSVRVILIGHSMGGIVAADTVLSIVLDKPINYSSSQTDPKSTNLNTMIFPFVQGILAFDTPYLGVSPSLLAHLSPPKSTLTQLSDLSNILIGSRISESKKESNPSNKYDLDATNSSKDTTPQSWTKIAAIAGTSLALAAGGATAAYLNKESITQSWLWIGSHLKFVSCLMKRDELQKRCQAMATLNSELSIGFGNIYTCLGKKGVEKSISGTRTFCIVPKKDNVEFWHKAVNDNAVDEINAHIFKGYYAMSQKAKSLIVQWTTDEWYSINTYDIKPFFSERNNNKLV
ncbi:putative pgap1-like protein [Erysiphe neolycopersici]|uniref:Putative pgap1-like protein n=1 Tax=Erysiphe neolycopersici TaxID=212602 RepID=A0A420HSW7_9PEZI|nr:putative pgap1-like protein [Erysiphe neolycopersici]